MSTNPYAQGAAPAAAVAASPEEQRQLDYELAVGPNGGYYLPKFEQFDQGGSKVGWHWPAFFVTSWWYLYRKMYGVGVLNLFVPVIVLIVASVVYGALKPPVWAIGLLAFVLLIAPSFLFSMFANALYWRHIRKVIRTVPKSIASHPEKRAARIERNGGTGVGPMIGVMAAVGFVGIGFVGMVAAISIPAYHDYTIRAQVMEGINLAAAPKARIQEIWESEHRWAEQDDIPGQVLTGKFVDKIEIFTGSIVITFGGEANENIRGQRMAITPLTNEVGDLRWSCGNAPTPHGWTPSDGFLGSDVPDKYLPRDCRSGS